MPYFSLAMVTHQVMNPPMKMRMPMNTMRDESSGSFRCPPLAMSDRVAVKEGSRGLQSTD